MRKLGLIGGMSWVSTRSYYEHINRDVQTRRSALCSAPLVIESLEFSELAGLSTDAEWKRASAVLTKSAKRLEKAGASAIVIGANSMHRVYDDVEAAVSVPVIHIADVTAAKMKSDGISRAALLGTRNVMMGNFYRKRFIAHGIELSAPEPAMMDELDRIIYGELMQGIVTRDAERALKTMLTNLGKQNIEAVVLGCTELELIVDVDATVLQVYDTTAIHSAAAADWILSED